MLENAGSGSGRHVIDLARGLLARGHRVTLLYSHARLEGWFERDLADTAGIVAATLPMRPGLGARDVATIGRVRAFIRDNGPFDVIHGHSSKGGALARIGGRGAAGVRVYTPHAFYTLGATPGSLRARFYTTLERTLAHLCDGIICVSAAEHRHALTLGLPAEKLFTVPNGLARLPPCSRASVRASLGIRNDAPCVGFVGRLASQKAVHRLLDAFAVAARGHPDARLVVVGFGPDEQSLREIACERGIDSAVIWTGEANGVEMMHAFDVFALPSRYEAFPYVLLEALATGLPIVSTRVGGVDELVHDGVNGYVIEQDDAAGFAARLSELLGDPLRRAAMGMQSEQIVASFDTDTMVDATLEVYRELLRRRQP